MRRRSAWSGAGISRRTGAQRALRHDAAPARDKPLRPDVPAKIVRQWVKDVDALDYPTKPIIPFIEVVHDRISLEVMRGCTRGCRFCQAGMITRPVREKSPEKLMRAGGRTGQEHRA